MACGGSNSAPEELSILQVAVLPDQARDALMRRHEPLIRYLEDSTGLELNIQYHESYDQFSRAVASGDIDLAWFGGLTFVRAENAGLAEPLVMRELDNRFVSHFIVKSDTAGQNVEDFRGAHLAFGSPLSTSGHLMPRYFLSERGINVPEYFASVRNTSAHDETVELVISGEADIGVVNSVILQSMIDDGRITPGQIRILEVTPTYANYVWGTGRNLHPGVKVKLRSSFLSLDAADPDHSAILALQGASGYIPAVEDDFRATRLAAAQLDLLDVAP
jgi:phosphonate transport system substrate-binding protein